MYIIRVLVFLLIYANEIVYVGFRYVYLYTRVNWVLFVKLWARKEGNRGSKFGFLMLVWVLVLLTDI
jgi:hypothetical protein